MVLDDLVEDLKPDLDEIRSISGELGLRRFTVTRTVRTWSGERPGVGTPSVATGRLANGIGADAQPVMVVQVSQKDIIASGGTYSDRDYKVGPMTPTYAASLDLASGGTADTDVDPAVGSQPTEIFWNVTGPGLPASGVWCDKISDESTSLHTFITLRATGRQP